MSQKPRRCPCCRQPLSKRKSRELSPLQWEKVQNAYWMGAWAFASDALLEAKRKIIELQQQGAPWKKVLTKKMMSRKPKQSLTQAELDKALRCLES